MQNWWHEPCGPTPIQECLLNEIKIIQRMCLPDLEPRHNQRCNWSLTTQHSLQVDVQKKKNKIHEVNLTQIFFFFFIKST